MENKPNGTIYLILVPIIFIVLAFIYDNAMVFVSNKRYRAVSENIIKEVLTNSYLDKEGTVKSLYEKNKYETEQLNVSYNGDTLYVYNVHVYPAFIGYVFGVKTYRVEINLAANIIDGEVVIAEIEGE